MAEFAVKTNALAGGRTRDYDQQGTKIISNLVGEVYSTDHDPQEKTDVQRSWLYSKDPAVNAVNQGQARKDQTFFYDNANSLPLGEGI